MHTSANRPKCLHAAGLMFGLSFVANVAAQSGAATPLERQTEEAFRQVQQQPQDLSGWSAYSRLLIEGGNYEGAIAALERLLLEPNANPAIRVQIAQMYFRLGSYQAAETTAREALADDKLPNDQREAAQNLAVLAAKRNQTNQLSGAIILGFRKQTNPTYRTNNTQVLAGGVLVAQPAGLNPQADTDVSAGLSLQHVFDLGAQNSASIVSGFNAYLVNYRSAAGSQLVANPTKPYDLQLLDLNTGLRFKPLPGAVDGLTVRPHLLVSTVVAQGNAYFSSKGLGVDVNWQPDEKTFYEFTLDTQRRDFANRIDVSTANLISGSLGGLRIRARREVAPGQRVVGEYAFRRSSTARAFYDYTSQELRGTYSISYASPSKNGSYWTSAVWVGALQRNYRAADPAVSATTSRRDNEWRVGFSQNVPIIPAWAMTVNLEHWRNQPNLPNFQYKNTSLSVTVAYSF